MPVDGAVAAFGTTKASVNCFHIGPDAHMVSFPVCPSSHDPNNRCHAQAAS